MSFNRGALLRGLRNQAGLTLDEVGEKIGVSKQTLYKYESNIVTNIPSDKIEALANLYQVSPAYIMGWNEKEKEIRPSDIQDELAKFIDRLDPSTGLAFFNGETEMDQETRELILMSLKNTLALSQTLSKNKEKQNED